MRIDDDHDNQHCDHALEANLEEILSKHEFDYDQARYNGEACHLARAAEMVALELIRIRGNPDELAMAAAYREAHAYRFAETLVGSDQPG